MDGYETLSRILKMDNNAKVIMVSASDQTELVQKCLDRGALGFVTKPFSKSQLLSAISTALNSGVHKNVVQLFSITRDKIEDSIKLILDNKASIILKVVKVIKEENSSQNLSKLNQHGIRAVQEIKEPLKIELAENNCTYVSEIEGQSNGLIISSINAEHLGKECSSQELLEAFNIINMKLLSTLADLTHLSLRGAPIRLYNKIKDNKPPTKEMAKATFDILHEGTIQLEMQLHFNLGLLWKRF
jgi:DNA-binding response OmpR family regulator